MRIRFAVIIAIAHIHCFGRPARAGGFDIPDLGTEALGRGGAFVAKADSPLAIGPAEIQNASQYEAWDMIAGRTAPELGGAACYLDIIGVNYYAANHWEMPSGHKLHWDSGSNDPRWRP